MYIPHSVGLIISVSPKCASTTIRNTFHVEGTRPITPLAVSELRKTFWKVVGVVRDPIDRFESAYNFFQHKLNGCFPNDTRFKDMESFTDAVLSGLSDDHWRPQCDIIGSCDRYADLETLPLGEKLNVSEHKEKITYRLDELKVYYSRDFKVRGNLWL